MKIAVIAASGKAGKLIYKEAVARGHEVVAVIRDSKKAGDFDKTLVKDIFALTTADLADFDVVIDAFGTYAPETLHLHTEVVEHLADILAGTAVRLLIVGGAGSLFVNAEHTLKLAETPDFPEAFKPLAFAQGKALESLRDRADVRWTFVSPAADFVADGAKTGHYQLAGEELTLNAAGQSQISYADYALALLDLTEQGGHEQERVSVVSK